ncbi:hypothetical protein [Mucilaginibacter celer]|uniref:Uncharacterized protein n=1 Tax=Mucilaginibacter celer TaxID=2305508 RepID=A0A494W4P4_9SPHI|nr:hypothetical protein [Mucilaginibacter celer]AYL98753.1 hypothetical protein HYN43_027315 [Mucilaginibacter celer]
MRFYSTYKQKTGTWFFVILAAIIICIFLFRQRNEPVNHNHDHIDQLTIALAIRDQPKPADTTIVNIRKLLIKLSDTYNMPVDSIADKVAAFHDVFDTSADMNIKGLKPEPELKKISNLELLRMVDKFENDELPRVPDSFKITMGMAINALVFKQVSS